MKWTSHTIADWPNLRSQWNALHQRLDANMLLSVNFLDPLVDVFGTPKLTINSCEHRGIIVAMAIIEPSGIGQHACWQPSQSPLGLWLADPAISTEKLIDELSKGLKSGIFGLTQQDPNDYPRPATSHRTTTLDYIETALVKLDGSFEDFWSGRGKNLRQNMRRQQNRLERENCDWRMTTITDPKQIGAAVAAYGELESKSWKAEGGTAITPDNDQGRFYTELLSKAAQRGQGRVYQMHYDNVLVATDLCIDNGQAIVILKTTYDESITTSSPAMLLRKSYFEQLFNETSLQRVEFYGRVMDWHRKLTDNIRVMYHVNRYRLPGMAAAHSELKQLRARLKELPATTLKRAENLIGKAKQPQQ